MGSFGRPPDHQVLLQAAAAIAEGGLEVVAPHLAGLDSLVQDLVGSLADNPGSVDLGEGNPGQGNLAEVGQDMAAQVDQVDQGEVVQLDIGQDMGDQVGQVVRVDIGQVVVDQVAVDQDEWEVGCL